MRNENVFKARINRKRDALIRWHMPFIRDDRKTQLQRILRNPVSEYYRFSCGTVYCGNLSRGVPLIRSVR